LGDKAELMLPAFLAMVMEVLLALPDVLLLLWHLALLSLATAAGSGVLNSVLK
jgi:hypothetical protein